jgi:hypothetical protein
MKIIYTENPLASKIILDAKDKEIFRLKLKIQGLEEVIYGAYFKLKKKDGGYPKLYDPEEGVNRLQEWVDEQNDEGDTKHFTECYEYYLDELENGEHCGDCTCVASSCTKCYAEGLLDLNTIAGLGNHSGSKVSGAFRTHETCAEVIEYLRKPITLEPEDGKDKSWWKPYIPRWNTEREHAIEWLIDYQKTKLGTEVEV